MSVAMVLLIVLIVLLLLSVPYPIATGGTVHVPTTLIIILAIILAILLARG